MARKRGRKRKPKCKGKVAKSRETKHGKRWYCAKKKKSRKKRRSRRRKSRR